MPVIKTKKALGEMTFGELEVHVDNNVAVQNIQRFAASAGCSFQSEKLDGYYKIILVKPEKAQQAEEKNELVHKPENNIPVKAKDSTIVVLSSNTMGNGDDALGRILMKSFVFALTQLETLPDAILLYNNGAKLSVHGAETLTDLNTLASHGVRILTCGTCLNHFGIADDLAVGEITNMYAIVEEMQAATHILRP